MSGVLDLVLAGQVVFGLAFPIALFVLVRFIVRRRALRAQSTGVVVSMRKPKLADPTAPMHAGYDLAIVRFATGAGEEVMTDCRLVGDTSHIRLGGHLPVRYDPSDPSRVALDRELGRGTLTLVWVLAIGTVLEVVGLATLALF